MDIGAHLGYYACYVSALFDGREEVHAIESNPLYANAAREAARLNGFSRMRVFQAALSDRVEQVQIDRVTVSRNGGQGSATMSVTLDSLVSASSCDLQSSKWMSMVRKERSY